MTFLNIEIELLIHRKMYDKLMNCIGQSHFFTWSFGNKHHITVKPNFQLIRT